MPQIGVDFGGTKVEVAALDAAGEYLVRRRQPNPGGYDAAVRQVAEMVAAVEAELGQRCSVGVGAPGSVSPRTGVMRNANSTYLNGRRFREDLSLAMAREVRLANDANCLALSEAVDGAAADAKVVFAVILGTGCGGGLVVDRRLIEGANGIAGEWGHTPLPWPQTSEVPGPTCWCGRPGCLELWVSGTGLRRDYAEVEGGARSGEEIVAAMRGGDAGAVAAFDRWLSRLGRGLAGIVDVLDPDMFVVGGGLSALPELYERLPQVMRPYVFSDVWEVALRPARWGDASGVRGAARLWGEDGSLAEGHPGSWAHG